jgi:hypothetical protein
MWEPPWFSNFIKLKTETGSYIKKVNKCPTLVQTLPTSVPDNITTNSPTSKDIDYKLVRISCILSNAIMAKIQPQCQVPSTFHRTWWPPVWTRPASNCNRNCIWSSTDPRLYLWSPPDRKCIQWPPDPKRAKSMYVGHYI